MKNLTSKFAKTIFISVFIFFGLTEANAQGPALNTNNYRTAIGLRAGGTSGLTIKHFMTPNHAIEGIIGAWPNAINLTGLFEWHVATPGAPGLKWYYGIGAHATVYRDRYFYYRENPNGNRYRYYRVRENGVGLGIDGIFGLEYKIKPIPLALSLDLKPYIEIGSNNVVYSSFDPGLGLKFTF
jgi:hypothetical protein